jgi:tripartite-type tricarboxylate transporter receptor subunit TctC
VLVVAPATAKSVKELVALAQAQPGKLIFSSGGAGSNNHMTAEQFGFNAGIKAVHVGFKSGSEALIEVLAGRAHYCMASVAAALPMIRDGRLQALGVTTPARSPLLPNVPAIVEVLPGFSRDASFGLFAPAGTPLSIRWQIGRDVARALDQPDVRDRLQGMAFAPVSSTPEELDKILREQVATFTALAQKVGLRTK